jgi:hypothetical protein
MKVHTLSCGHKIIDNENGIKAYMDTLINHVQHCEKAQEILAEVAMEKAEFVPDVWRDGTSSHKRPARQEFDYNACADRVLERGYMCAGCHFDQKCHISTRFAEMRREEQQKYNESLAHGPYREKTQVRLITHDEDGNPLDIPYGVRE